MDFESLKITNSFQKETISSVTREYFQIKGQYEFNTSSVKTPKADMTAFMTNIECRSQAVKRRCTDELSTERFKLRRFQSSEEDSDQSDSSNELDEDSDDSIQFQSNTSSIDHDTLVSLEGLNLNSISSSPGISIENSNVIFSLTRSPDFGMMKKIARALRKNTFQSVELAVESFGLKNAIKFVFVHENESVICCQFYVGSTLVAIGSHTSEKSAKETALKYGTEILTNLSNLPYETLDTIKQKLENWWNDDLTSCTKCPGKSDSGLVLKAKILRYQLSKTVNVKEYADVLLILKIIERLLNEKSTEHKKMNALQKILLVASKLKCISEIHFFHFGEDPGTRGHDRIFHCDFVIKNIFICQAKASSKKKAKRFAAEQGYSLLKSLIESCELKRQENIQEPMQSLKINSGCFHMNNYSCSSTNAENSSTIQQGTFNELLRYTLKTETHMEIFASSNGCECQRMCGLKSSPMLFRINSNLLDETRKRKLIIFVTKQRNDTISIICNSAAKCKKGLIYEVQMDALRSCQKMFRCSITLDEVRVGEGQGATLKQAQSKASKNALQLLQKQVYTIQINKDPEEVREMADSPMVLLEELIRAGGSTDMYELIDRSDS